MGATRVGVISLLSARRMFPRRSLEADEFFNVLCASHLHERCPEILKYLGLAPGWRFLVAPGYEDVWYDANLLNV